MPWPTPKKRPNGIDPDPAAGEALRLGEPSRQPAWPYGNRLVNPFAIIR
jgi:hypothetical protein